MLNRRFFFDQVRGTLFNGRLRQRQVNGLAALLDLWEAKYARRDDRWLAYMLATTHHETDATMQPIEEYGRGRGKPYGVADPQTGHAYYGRGYVQLTWKENYARMARVTGVDLVAAPARALEPAIAAAVLFHGMINGSFTGRRLGHYFAGDVERWRDARRIINGLDKANLVADLARRYYAALSHTT